MGKETHETAARAATQAQRIIPALSASTASSRTPRTSGPTRNTKSAADLGRVSASPSPPSRASPYPIVRVPRTRRSRLFTRCARLLRLAAKPSRRVILGMHLIVRPARHTRARRRASRDANAIHTASSSPRPHRASSGIVRAANETGNESNSPGRIPSNSIESRAKATRKRVIRARRRDGGVEAFNVDARARRVEAGDGARGDGGVDSRVWTEFFKLFTCGESTRVVERLEGWGVGKSGERRRARGERWWKAERWG